MVPEGFRGFKDRVNLSSGFLQPQRILCGPGEGTVKILWGYLGSQGAQWVPESLGGFSVGCQQSPEGGACRVLRGSMGLKELGEALMEGSESSQECQ